MKFSFRSASSTILLSLFLFPFPFFLLPVPSVSAANVQFSCWCRDETTRTCNHHQIDSGIQETDSLWASLGLVIVSGGTLGTNSTMDAILSGHPDLDARLRASDVRNACTSRCAADGDRAFRFETTYRAEICTECNPSPDSSCSESASDRLAFGKADVKAKVDECEARKKATSLLPVHLAIPIGGVSQVSGLPDYINVAYRYMVTIVLVAAIVMVVYGGFRYLVGATIGDIQAGKKIIQDALVGMLIVLGAYTILSTINPDTTLLSLTPPTTINCQELALPDAVKKTTCDSDSECSAGERCVLAKNVVFDASAVAESTVEGAEEGRKLARDSRAAGLIGLVTSPYGLSSLFLESREARRERGGITIGGFAGAVGESALQIERDLSNIRVCSTGEQGSPCVPTPPSGPESAPVTKGELTGDRFCREGLACVGSWSMCWQESGNGPGMPCDVNANCANNRCVAVEGTEFKVCEIQVNNGSLCSFVRGTTTVFPIQCSGYSNPTQEFVCAACPAVGGAGGVRNWRPLQPGESIQGQCKPRAEVDAITNCAP